MPQKKYKVIKCEKCETLTYKKSTFKTVKCPICHKTLSEEPIRLFATTREAIAFIKGLKIKNMPEQGGLFETFG